MTYHDFDDDAIDLGATRFSNGHASSLSPSNLSQIVSAKPNKPKVVFGGDDFPQRVDIGKRRRKHEFQVLAGAGIKSEDDVWDEVDNFEVDADADMGGGNTGDSEDEYYKPVEQRQAAKLAAKAEYVFKDLSSSPIFS